ncbi:MAG: ABC transporter permease [Longimicrobiales bacterium]
MDVILESLSQAARLLLSGDAYVWRILLLSLRVSGAGVLLGLLVGLPIGIAVGLLRFPGRRLAIALIHTGFALPPVVVGLFVYMVFSRAGPAGHLELLFTPSAMVIAQALLAAPYVAGISMAAVQAVPPDVRLQARGLGASRMRALLTHLAEARLGLFAAVVAGFGAVISEVGAVMMVGGNIAGETRVMTTAIVLETRRGNFATALAFGLVLLFLAFIVNALLTHAQQARVRSGVHRPFA